MYISIRLSIAVSDDEGESIKGVDAERFKFLEL